MPSWDGRTATRRQVGRFFSPKHPPRMKVLCGRTPEAVKTAADQLGWEETSTDWHEVVTRTAPIVK